MSEIYEIFSPNFLYVGDLRTLTPSLTTFMKKTPSYKICQKYTPSLTKLAIIRSIYDKSMFYLLKKPLLYKGAQLNKYPFSPICSTKNTLCLIFFLERHTISFTVNHSGKELSLREYPLYTVWNNEKSSHFTEDYSVHTQGRHLISCDSCHGP